MINNIFYFFIFILITSCAVISKKGAEINFVTYEKFDALFIGQKKSEVLKALGAPEKSESIILKNKTMYVLEYVNLDTESSQRASIVIDPETDSVSSITFIPAFGEHVESKKYLTEIKYKNLKFDTFLNPQCSSHSASAEAILVNIDNGILIAYVKKDLGVLAITRMSKKEIILLVENIKNCLK